MARTKKRTKKKRTKAAAPRMKKRRTPRPQTGPSVEVMSDKKAAEVMAGMFDGSCEFVGVWLGDGEELVSTVEAAERLGVSVGVVDEMIRDGRLESEKLGQVVMVFGSDLDEFMPDRQA